MTIEIPTLGPSWLPKLGGLLSVIGAALQVVPDNAPGASSLKPWSVFLIALGAGLTGFTTRQTNVTSEQHGVTPEAVQAASPSPTPAKP